MAQWYFARARAWASVVALAVVVFSGACKNDTVTPADTPDVAAESLLRASSNLTGGCYEFPPLDPTHTDHVTLGVSVALGAPGIDFRLKDAAGGEHHLAELLKTGPVVLLFGAFS